MFLITAVVSAGALTGVSASPLTAQAPAYFTSLSVPPPTVGTCLEPAQGTVRATSVQRAPRLVITSRTPSARRELSLRRDSTGVVVGFTETVHVSNGRSASTGETVVAALRSDGRIIGYVMRTKVALSESRVLAFDSASLQRMRDNAQSSSTQAELDTLGQRRVRVLATWLSTRCPG